jgi:hypothetical protein
MPLNLDTLQLPFEKRKQAAVLWFLATDRQFFEHAKVRIKPAWFADPIMGKVYAALLFFYDGGEGSTAYRRLPKKPELLESRSFMLEEPNVRSAMRAAVEMAYNESQVYGLDVLKAELTEWLHAYIYKEGIEQATALFQQQKFSQAYKIAAERIKLIQETKFEEDCEFDFSDLEHSLMESEARIADGVTFGLKAVDDALSPGGVTTGIGGLFRRDTTCLMAPVNIGKTTAMLSVVCANIRAHKRVLLVVHEGEPSDIRDKLLCNLLDVDKTVLWSLRLTPEGRQILVMMEADLKKYLTFIPYIKAQMTIDDVLPLIRRKCEEATGQGRPYELLADDYPELLMSEHAKAARMEERARIALVYLNFTQLANELNLHCLVNIQTNRSGSSVNRSEDRLLSMEDVAESWGAMAKMTNVITVNRSPNDMAKDRLTYYIVKSRSSGTGRAIVARTNFGHAVAHSNDAKYGAAWYFGSKMIAGGEMDHLLAVCSGGEITEDKVREQEMKQQAEKAAAKVEAKAELKAATDAILKGDNK